MTLTNYYVHFLRIKEMLPLLRLRIDQDFLCLVSCSRWCSLRWELIKICCSFSADCLSLSLSPPLPITRLPPQPLGLFRANADRGNWPTGATMQKEIATYRCSLNPFTNFHLGSENIAAVGGRRNKAGNRAGKSFYTSQYVPDATLSHSCSWP